MNVEVIPSTDCSFRCLWSDIVNAFFTISWLDSKVFSVLQFLQQAAGKYMGSESKPSAGGNGGGVDWNNLSALTNQYSALDKNGDGQVDAKDLMGGL